MNQNSRKTFVIGMAVNARTGRTFFRTYKTKEEAIKAMTEYCAFWEISRFTINECCQSFYEVLTDEDIKNGEN